MTHLDPLKVRGTGEIALLWIAEVINSGYPEKQQYLMTSKVVRLLGRYCKSHPNSIHQQSTWVPPLLKFLALCENFPATESPPHPGLITLWILSKNPQDADFGPDILPTLASMLSSDHPLRSRKLALAVFGRFTSGWLSRVETASGHRLDKLLQAVGDPFHFPQEPSRDQDRELERTVGYEPTEVVVVLIEFASSELWRSHLRPSNFTSCEDILSTDNGRTFTLRGMFLIALTELSEFLCTPTKIVTAVRCFEELGCLNTARAVIAWAWVSGMADVMDEDSWKLIEDETLRFYRTHGLRFLAAMKRCIIQNSDGLLQLRQVNYFAARYEGPPFRVKRSRRSSNLSYRTGGIHNRAEWEIDRVISQACQLRRLYLLFGYDPTTWQEAVRAGEVDENREVLSGHSDTSDPFVGWECDYP